VDYLKLVLENQAPANPLELDNDKMKELEKLAESTDPLPKVAPKKVL
jgi:hypothetical protein